MATHEASASLAFSLAAYGEHELQKVGMWEFEPRRQSGFWLVFIHGGAWRSPVSTHSDFLPSINHMLASTSFPLSAVAGFASINYRLSGTSTGPHPALHPDHIRDVRSALGYLQDERRIGSQYILMGHSVGATLAFQVLMASQAAGSPLQSVQLPAVAVGIAGIYEFYDFSHRHGAYYIEFVSDALGPDQSGWNGAAPLFFKEDYKVQWPNGRAVLAYSPDDTLVDGDIESGNMEARLRKDGTAVDVVKFTGEHDVAWEDGNEIALLVAKILHQLSIP